MGTFPTATSYLPDPTNRDSDQRPQDTFSVDAVEDENRIYRIARAPDLDTRMFANTWNTDSGSGNSEIDRNLALWVAARAERILALLPDLERRRDWIAIARLLHEYGQLPSVPTEAFRDRRNRAFGRINDYRRVLPPFVRWREPGAPLDLVLDRDTLEARALPDRLVLLPYGVPGDRARWGLVKYDPDQPGGKLQLDLRARLAADPAAVDALRGLAARRGEALADGPFLRFRIGDLATSAPSGVLSARASLNGDEITLKLTLDAVEANKLLWLLAQPAGIGLTFPCAYTGGDGQDRFELPLALSAARRDPPGLALDGGALTNPGRYPALARFLRGPDGSLWPAASGREPWLSPGGRLAVAGAYRLPPGADPARAAVPAEATELAGVDWQADFTGDPGIFETVTLANHLRDPDADSRVDRVEAWVTQLVGEGGDRRETRLGPVTLDPLGRPGSERPLSFLRPARGPRRYRVEATAHFVGGGHAELPALEYNGVLLDIDRWK